MDRERLKQRLYKKTQIILESLPEPFSHPQIPKSFSNLQSQTRHVRSTSVIKLPSLTKLQETPLIPSIRKDKSQPRLNTETKQISPTKSRKVIRQSQSIAERSVPTNTALTQLLQQEILSIPELVVLLRGLDREEFVYLKVKGIYDYQACGFQEKGENYLIISGKGIIMEGKFIKEDQWQKEEVLYKKLRKIEFFKQFLIAKSFFQWRKQLWKHINSISTNKLSKVSIGNSVVQEQIMRIRSLCVEFEEFSLLEMVDLKGYSLEQYSNEHGKRAQNLERNLDGLLSQITECLKVVCFDYLSSYQFVPKEFGLMNRMLGNAEMIGLRFDLRNSYINSLMKIYHTLKLCDLILNETLRNLLVRNYQEFVLKVDKKIEEFQHDTGELEYIKRKSKPEDYSGNANSLLNESHSVYNTWITFQLEVVYNKIEVKPTLTEVTDMFREYSRQVVRMLSKNKLKFIESSVFDFVIKNIRLPTYQQQIEVLNFQEYTSKHTPLKSLLDTLTDLTSSFESVLDHRLLSLSPILDIYRKYSSDPNPAFDYYGITEILKDISKDIQTISYFEDGTWIPFGYLNYNTLKTQVQNQIKEFKQKLAGNICINYKAEVESLKQIINQHLEDISPAMITVRIFVRVMKQLEVVGDEMAEMVNRLENLKKFNLLYEEEFKSSLQGYGEISGLLSNVKSRIMSFQMNKDNHLTKYRNEATAILVEVQAETDELELVLMSKRYEDPRESDGRKGLEEQNMRIQSTITKNNNLNEIMVYLGLSLKKVEKLPLLQFEYETLRDIWEAKERWEVLRDKLLESMLQTVSQSDLYEYREVVTQVQGQIRKKPKISISLQLKQNLTRLNKLISIISGLKQIPFSRENQEVITSLIYPPKQNPASPTNIFSKNIPLSRLNVPEVISKCQEILEYIFSCKKEEDIVRFISELEKWWDKIKLVTVPYNQRLTIFGENQKLRKEIEDLNIGLIGILNSRFGGERVRDKCKHMLNNIQKLSHLLQEIFNYQTNMLNIYPAMTSEYCQTHLLSDSKKYQTLLHSNFKMMKQLIIPTKFLTEMTLNLLQSNNKQFQLIRKNLDQFLEKKRIQFQRFYFLEDKDLIELLMSHNVNLSLERMFEGIKSWYQQEGEIVGVVGDGNEELRLRNWRYSDTQEVDTTFRNLEESIRYTLKTLVRECLHKYQVDLLSLREAQKGLPWICVYAVEKILFCKQIEINFLSETSENDYTLQLEMLRSNLNQLLASPFQYSNLITVILQQIHFTQELYRENIRSPLDYQWQTMLRYYYEEDIVMRCLGSKHVYGGEYQGVWEVMVDTKDIRRVHATVLGGLNWANGTLIQGPSGTGKTETLKELARCMAKYCMILNCSTLISTKLVQKLLSGLCYTGSWICFDEINRLDAQVMSVIASHILEIKNAILSNSKRVMFSNKEMRMKSGVAILCTMNPNYEDRTPLTDNLKHYFRYVTINFPEYEKIIEVMLFSRGFKEATTLSTKINKVHQLLNIQFNQEKHYDFGLRAMKSLFVYLDRMLGRNRVETEEGMVRESLFYNIKSRVGINDSKVLVQVLNDVFEKYTQTQLSVNELLEEKYKSLKQASSVGTIVLGRTSCKSSLINRYIDETSPITKRYNANSLPLSYFIGTKETPGVIEQVTLESISNPKDQYLLYIDSTIKSEWVENLNTLLDATRILTLPNGARIKLHSNFRIIMESDNLHHVSLATITRSTVIFLQPELITKEEYVRGKLQQYNFPKILYTALSDMINAVEREKIQWVFNIFPALLPSYPASEEWQYTEMIGVQRIVVYLISLLGELDKIKHLLIRDLIPSKLPVSRYYISFDRYVEGEYLLFQYPQPAMISPVEVYIPSYTSCLHQHIIKSALQLSPLPHCLQIIGAPGSGKSNSLRHCLTSLPESVRTVWIRVNKYLSSPSLYRMIADKFQKEGSTSPSAFYQSMIPIENYQKLVIIIEDINYSSENISEFVRSFIQTSTVTDTLTLQNKKMRRYLVINEASALHNKRLLNHTYPLLSQLTQEGKHQLINTIFRYSCEGKLKGLNEELREDFVDSVIPRFSRMLTHFSQEVSSISPFTMREVSHIAQSFNLLTLQSSSSLESIMELILYQINRVYHQNILATTQRQTAILSFKKYFSDYFNKQFRQQLQKSCKFVFYDSQEPLFTNIKSSSYQRVNDINQFTDRIQESLSEFGFKDIYLSNQLSRLICKIGELRMFPGRNCLIHGSYGIGKTTLVKIVGHLLKEKIVEISTEIVEQQEINRLLFEYIENSAEKNMILLMRSPSLQWLAEIEKKFSYPLQTITIEQKSVAFQNVTSLIENYERKGKSFQTQIKDYINTSLSRLLFVILSNEDSSLEILRNHRSFFNTFQINYIDFLSEESLYQISNKILLTSSKDMLFYLDRIVRLSVSSFKKICGLGKEEYFSESEFGLTPVHFIKFLKSIVSIQKSKLEELKIQNQKLCKSISKLQESEGFVEEMKADIIRMEPQLKFQEERLREMIFKLEDQKRESTEIKMQVNNEIEIVESKRNEVQILKEEAQDDLNRSILVLNASLESISMIKRDKLSEIKMTQHPHPLVLFTLENLCILLGEAISWENIKRVLWDTELLYRLKNCNPKHQDALKIKKRMSAMNNYSSEQLVSISSAAKVLGQWVQSALNYAEISHMVELKRAKLLEISKDLIHKEYALSKTEGKLKQTNQRILEIEKEYEVMFQSSLRTSKLIGLNKLRINRAIELQSGLVESKKRWVLKIPKLQQEIRENPGNSLLRAAELEFTCCYSLKIRREFINYLKQLSSLNSFPYSSDYSILSMYSRPTLKRWERNGLQSDENSIQNGVCLQYHLEKIPIIFDPENQAIEWLSAQYSSLITITKTSFSNSTKTVQKSIRQGHKLVLLIEGESNLDYLTRNLLESPIEVRGNRRMIDIYKYSVDVGQGYSLMFLVKSSTNKLLKSLFSKHPLINFTVSEQTLQDQLTIKIVRIECESLYLSKMEMENLNISNSIELNNLQTLIIEELANSQVYLLDNEQVVQAIEKSIRTGDRIGEIDASIFINKLTLDQIIRDYQKLTKFPAILYMKLKQMSYQNQYLSFSYELYSSIFIDACKDSLTPQKNPQRNSKHQTLPVERLNKIKKYILNVIRKGFSNIECLALGFLLCTNDVPREDVYLFLQSGYPRSTLEEHINIREASDEIKYFYEGFSRNKDQVIEEILNSPNPYKFKEYPISFFSILFIIKLLKPERFRECVEQMIDYLGYKELLEKQPTQDLIQSLSQISNTNPLLVIMGEDPLIKITGILKKKGKTVRVVSLGEGQIESAELALEEIDKVDVLILHNLHLSQRVAAKLSKFIEQIELNKPHQDFRLIIITKPTIHLTKSVCQKCIKLFIQPSSGIKKQMKQLLLNYFHIVENQSNSCKSLAYTISLLHSILNDRKLYLPKGWNYTNPSYTFPEVEFEISLKIIKEVFNWDTNPNCVENNAEQVEKYQVSIRTLMYLIEEINYQGRVLDELDRVKIRALAKQFINVEILDQIRMPQYRVYGNKSLKLPTSFDMKSLMKSVDSLPADHPEMFGLNPLEIPTTNYPTLFISYIQQLFQNHDQQTPTNKQNFSLTNPQLPQLSHPLSIVNYEIQQARTNKHSPNTKFLLQLHSNTKIFDLRAFSNPKRFFVSVIQHFCQRNQVKFDDVILTYLFSTKEDLFGISNLRLEGGKIVSGVLQDAKESVAPVMYLYPVLKSKEKINSNYEYVRIPLYRRQSRQGTINSFGENTNLLTMVTLMSKREEEFWMLRGTALVLEEST